MLLRGKSSAKVCFGSNTKLQVILLFTQLQNLYAIKNGNVMAINTMKFIIFEKTVNDFYPLYITPTSQVARSGTRPIRPSILK